MTNVSKGYRRDFRNPIVTHTHAQFLYDHTSDHISKFFNEPTSLYNYAMDFINFG